MVSLDASTSEAERVRSEAAATPAADAVERESLRRVLDEAIAQLRTDYRVAVTLRYDEGLSFEEIAQVMGIPETTARSHVHRARKELASILRAQGWEYPET
jgi:RNA polymerase sigma-70 factor (ECF subfamily)